MGSSGSSDGGSEGAIGAAVGAAGGAAVGATGLTAIAASPFVVAGGFVAAGIFTAGLIAAIVVPIVIVTQGGTGGSSSTVTRTEPLARGTTNVQTTVPNIAVLTPTGRRIVSCFNYEYNLTKTNDEIIDFLKAKPYFGNFTKDYNVSYVCDRNLFLNASISFHTVSNEYVYTKQNILDTIKTIQNAPISSIPGLLYTPNKDMFVQLNGRWTEFNGTITLANDCAINLDYQDTSSEYIDELANEACISYENPFEETTIMEETYIEDDENQQRLINENKASFDLQSGLF